MKVLQLIDTLRSGGAERMAVNMAQAMTREGIKNQLVVSREEGMQANRVGEDTQVHLLRKTSFFDLKALRKLLKLVKAFEPDVIHAHSTSVFWGVIAKLSYGRTKLIWHDHYGLSDQLQPKDRMPERVLTKWIDGIIVVNEKLRRWLVESTSYPQHKVKLIANFPYLKGAIGEKGALREQVNLVHLANFRRQKDHLTLLSAFEKVCARDSNHTYKLVLAGNTELDREYSLEIDNFIQARNLASTIEIKGEVEDVEELLAIADIGVLTSLSEGLPVSLLEYALAGLPALATDVGDCSAVLKKGALGTIVPAGDPERVADAILDIVARYDEKLAQAKLLQDSVERNYGAIGFINQYKLFVESIQ